MSPPLSIPSPPHMNRFLRLLAFLVTTSTISAAISTVSVGLTTLTIDGVPCGAVHSAEGGEPRGIVVVEGAAGGALPKKHLGSFVYDPITIVVSFPLPPPVLECIKALCIKRSSRKTLVLAQYDSAYNPAGLPMEATNALLTEVRIPAFEAASKEAARVTLIFTPESTRTSKSAPAFTAKTGIPHTIATGANFKIAIGGLPTGMISRIDPLTIKLAAETAAPEFSNLTLTIARSNEADWYAWRDNFVLKGANDDASERTGTLEILTSATSTTPPETVLTFQFGHLGLVRTRAAAVQSTVDSVAKFQAELYYETLNFTGPTPRPLTAVTTLASATMAGTSLQTAVASTSGSTAVASAPVVGTGIVTNPADQGGRDPKDFPRLEGTVRKTYSSIQQKTSLQEMVVYSSRESLDPLEQSYMKTLEAAGWEFLTRTENNDAVGRMHRIIVNWKNGLRSVAVTLTEVKEGGSEIGVNLTTKI
jgi:hypothetical protein